MAGVKGMKGGGGRRPGAGRKALGASKKTQVTITITQEQQCDLRSLRARGVDVNDALGRELHRLAVAYDLADYGII